MSHVRLLPLLLGSIGIVASSYAAAPATGPSPAADIGWGERSAGLRCRLELSTGYDIAPGKTPFADQGERLYIRGAIQNIGDDGVAIPAERDNDTRAMQANFAYAALEVRTPDGVRCTFDPFECRKAPANGPRPPLASDVQELQGGKEFTLFYGPIFLGSSAPRWLASDTGKPTKLSLAKPGEYEFRLIFAVPPGGIAKKPDVPVWTGSVASSPMRLKVVELPFDERLTEPTAAQMNRIRSGNWAAVASHIHFAYGGEGVARYLIGLARKQPGKIGTLLPIVAARAVPSPELRDDIMIDGPYLKEYAELLLDIGEGKIEGVQDPATGGGTGVIPYDQLLRPVVLYVLKHPADEKTRERLTALAHRYASPEQASGLELGKDGPDVRAETVTRPSTAMAWSILIELGVFHPGSQAWYPEFQLGKPTVDSPAEKGWVIPSNRPVTKGLFVALKDGAVVSYTIRTVRRQESATKPAKP